MLNKIEKEILNKIVDKYERSKSFLGVSKVNQSFAINIEKEFPKYVDHAEFDFFSAINEAIEQLLRENLILATKQRNGIYSRIEMNMDRLEEIYYQLQRVPKKDINSALITILSMYIGKDNEVLAKYAEEQINNLACNKKVKYYDGDLEEYRLLLEVIEAMFQVKNETFVREFSMNFFKDSKTFEKMEGKIKSLIYEYGDFPEKDSILEELNIIKTPTYVCVKGKGVIDIEGQILDLSKVKGDIAFSTITLASIKKIIVTGKKVITIENLTSFHSFIDKEALVVYLGGFHNSVRRQFLLKIFQNNPNIQYLHFGDIDAGGFYIFEHLKRVTGIPFNSYRMDISSLIRYEKYWKKLTSNDKERLKKLLGKGHDEVIQFMLDNNCKLEQEIISI